jgi:hypothetical protein
MPRNAFHPGASWGSAPPVANVHDLAWRSAWVPRYRRTNGRAMNRSAWNRLPPRRQRHNRPSALARGHAACAQKCRTSWRHGHPSFIGRPAKEGVTGFWFRDPTVWMSRCAGPPLRRTVPRQPTHGPKNWTFRPCSIARTTLQEMRSGFAVSSTVSKSCGLPRPTQPVLCCVEQK